MFELDVFDFTKTSIKFEGYTEFCENIRSMDMLVSPELYMEVVSPKRKEAKDKLADMVDNTKRTTKQVAGVYDDVTDAGGTIIKSVWDASMEGLSIGAKLIKFVLTNLSKVINIITRALKAIKNIPSTIKNKIKGNIKIYVTGESVEVFYNNIFPMISKFISISSELSQGDTWKTFFTQAKDVKSLNDLKNLVFSKTDVKKFNEMKTIASKLKSFNIELSVVDLGNPNIANIYFGNIKGIKFRDLHGKLHEDSYYDALISLMKDLESNKSNVEALYQTLGAKYSKTEFNQAMNQIDIKTQQQINAGIQQITVVVNVIAKLIKSVIADMNTIQKNYTAIAKKKGIANDSVKADKYKISIDDYLDENGNVVKDRIKHDIFTGKIKKPHLDQLITNDKIKKLFKAGDVKNKKEIKDWDTKYLELIRDEDIFNAEYLSYLLTVKEQISKITPKNIINKFK